MAAKKKEKKKEASIKITPVNLQIIKIPIVGTAPYCQHNFSAKARNKMLAAQMVTEGAAQGRGTKKPRDLDEEFKGAMHISSEGWIGIPCAAFRAAMISACRIAGVVMTKAKISIFVDADGLDAETGQPLVRLCADDPERSEMVGKLETGTAMVIIRPLWAEWGAVVTVRFDADQFSASSVVNLLDRAGQQVGIGEGRPDSKKSAGLGWGTFMVDLDLLKDMNNEDV